VEFSKVYSWYPGCVGVACDCREKLSLPGSITLAAADERTTWPLFRKSWPANSCEKKLFTLSITN
jgi:hypothetical protein